MANASGPLTTGHRPGEIIPIGLAASVQIYKGAAAAVSLGTGLGTPMNSANALHQFIGVWSETILSPATGTYYTRVIRQGCFSFGNPNAITATSIGEPAYFVDDNNITLTEGTTYAGVITAVDSTGNVWVDISQAVRQLPGSGRNITNLVGTADALGPHDDGTYLVTGAAAVDAMTLAAPTAGTDDGVVLEVVSNSAYAHTITATGLLKTGASAVNVATFAAHPGASVRLLAYNGYWYVLAQNAITFS